MNIKRLLTVGIVLFILLGAFGLYAFADATVVVASSEFQTHQGESYMTTIFIPDGANIVDFDITLKYNTELISLVSIEEHENIKGAVVYNDQTPGEIAINYTRTNKNVTEYLPLLNITFNVNEEIGIGSYDCFTVDQTKPYIAHRLNAAGNLDVVDFTCNFAKLVIYEMGDVDLSKAVDIGDATYIRRHLAKLTTLTDYQLSFADTYFDGVIDIADAVALQRHLARLDVLYGNRVNITFFDVNGEKFATKSVLYNGTLRSIPLVPEVDGRYGGVWSLSKDEEKHPEYANLTNDLSVYAFYTGRKNPAMDYYKRQLTNQYHSGDLLSSDIDLWSSIEYQDGWRASLIWSSDCNYVLNGTTGHFMKPTYPQKLNLTVTIISRDNNNKIDSEDTITFAYDVPGIYRTPTKAEIAEWLRQYFYDEESEKNRVNYDVKLITSINNEVIPVNEASYDSYEVRIDWYQRVDGTLQPIDTIKRTSTLQLNDYVAIVTFNGKPLEDDGRIDIQNVEVAPITQMEIRNYIINQIAVKQGTLATNDTELWNETNTYGATVTWVTGAPDIAYVQNNVIKLNSNAISGTTLPLNAHVSFAGPNGEPREFVISYNLTVSCNNQLIKAPENMDVELYRAIKNELFATLGYTGDITSAALADVRFVNLDLSEYPEISSLRGLSYCKNLRTIDISGLHITDGTMNQIATLSYLEAFIARGCGLDNLTDGGGAALRNATNLRMIDLTDNNFTSLDSVFAEGIRYGNLREVYLSKNKLTDINALSRAPMMTYLSLSENGLTTEGTAVIENYPFLLYLSLANNHIDSVEHLTNLNRLKELRLQGNELTNVNALRRLVNLELLYLGHNKIKDVGNLNTLTNLKVLYINDNQIFDVSNLRDLTNLEAFNVSNNKITSLSVLNNYKSTLTEIYAENNQLTDFSFINGASKLHILMLAGNKVEMAQSNMGAWLSGLPELEILTLSDIRLNDLSFLAPMTKLARLDVANCGLHAFSGETSNVQMIADRYATLRVLNISNNDLSDNEAEIMKLRDVPLLTVFYADNICHNLDAYTLTYSMTELKYISLENCGISNLNWLYKFHELAYVDLAGNNIAGVDLEGHISNASIKTLKELYLDTNVPCSLANAFRVMDFDVERLSLAGITIGKMEYMPNLEKIKYLNLDNTGLTNLTGADLELADLYSIERYQTLESIDVSHLETSILTVENLPAIKTVYAVGATDSKLFYEENLHALQRLYNKGVTCYLYDKQTEYEPVAQTEGGNILALLPDDISRDITVAADNVFSDNNPFLQSEINDFNITWTVSNSDNYEVTDNHLSVKSYAGLEDEDLTVTATITVYPDQAPVSRDFTIHTHILRASNKYFSIDATGYSEQLTRDANFTYSLTLKAAQTEGFTNPVKPVEDAITYSYATTSSIPYPRILTVKSNNTFAVASDAPLNSTVTINIDVTHANKSGAVVADVDRISVPVTVVSRTFTVTFHMNGGTIVDANNVTRESCEMVEDASIFENLSFSRAGYTFGGWYTDEGLTDLFSKTGAEAIMPSRNLDLYAKWIPISFTVFFDVNGGACSTASIEALSDVPLGTLPTPIRQYYTFDGWFTADDERTPVTEATVFTRNEDITLYAHWTLNSFIVTFNANGGSVDTTSLRAYCGKPFGTLPTPNRDYYTFDGWFTESAGGEKVTSDACFFVAEDMELYAHWTINPAVGWTAADMVPADAEIVGTKWSYTKTTTTESTATSMSGYTQTGSYWSKTGSGSFNYASFPSGFDTSNWYYKNFRSSAYSAYETATTKREVDYWWSGWIYWHWMYDSGVGGNGTSSRAIYNQYGYGPTNGFLYKYFGAWASSTDYQYGGTGYTNNLGWDNYIRSDMTSWDDCQGATRWFRFNYYTCSYTDYQKIFQYRKVEDLESTTQVSAGTNGNVTISNVNKWVMWRPKTMDLSVTEAGSTTLNGHTYTLYTSTSPIAWEMAKFWCENNNGYLACVTTAEENAAISNLASGKYAWLGGYRVNGGDWAWVSDEAFSYSDWRNGEPNNTNFVEWYLHYHTDSGWNDIQALNASVTAFVIETEIN